jgi:hypothetical protein
MVDPTRLGELHTVARRGAQADEGSAFGLGFLGMGAAEIA